MRLLCRTPRLNARPAQSVFVLSMLIFFAVCATGHNSALAVQREFAPDSASTRDISGVWIGQLSERLADGRVGHGTLYLRLQQSGAQISGVAGDRKKTTLSIEDVVLSGKHLNFLVTSSGLLL